MSPLGAIYTFGAGAPALWHIDGHERLRRQLVELDAQLAGAWRGSAESTIPEANTACALVLNADYLFDKQSLRGLMERTDVVLVDDATGCVAALLCAAADAPHWQAKLSSNWGVVPEIIEQFASVSLADLGNYDDALRRSTPPTLHHVPSEDRAALEAHLYGNAYKGITDLVTKWWWPAPAKIVVALCARLGLSANAVTLVGLLLMLVACWCFYTGNYLTGLLCGWIMTFLDTVDGKLARVTVTSSRLGHVLDHGMDILHPPFWYWCWLVSTNISSQDQLVILIFAGYIAGRLIEAAFHVLGSCGMFSWRPLDAYFRLVTARRNPCLIILTVCAVVGAPELGIWGVLLWTLVSSVLMLLRLFYAIGVRLTQGPLQSWLAQPQAERLFPQAYRTFAATSKAYG